MYNSYKYLTGGGSVSGWTRLIRYGHNVVSSIGNRTESKFALNVNGAIWTNVAYYMSSDRRIKKEIEELHDDECLQKILKLKPSKYRYIDSSKNRNETDKEYGFIAQEVEEVFPEAVQTEKDRVPNIMKIAKITDKNKITLGEQKEEVEENVVLKVDMEVVIFDIVDNKKTCKIVEIYDENYFEIDIDIEGDLVFVYGSVVEDLHTLNMKYINCFNMSARITPKDRSTTTNINDLERAVSSIMESLCMQYVKTTSATLYQYLNTPTP